MCSAPCNLRTGPTDDPNTFRGHRDKPPHRRGIRAHKNIKKTVNGFETNKHKQTCTNPQKYTTSHAMSENGDGHQAHFSPTQHARPSNMTQTSSIQTTDRAKNDTNAIPVPLLLPRWVHRRVCTAHGVFPKTDCTPPTVHLVGTETDKYTLLLNPRMTLNPPALLLLPVINCCRIRYFLGGEVKHTHPDT